MRQNIFWDKKLSEQEAIRILSDPDHERFSNIAALLLSRTNDLKLVFSTFISKEMFCRKWKQIKIEMRKNKWTDERIDFWDQIHRTLYGKLRDQITRHKNQDRPVHLFATSSEILRNERKKKGMTQKQLAKTAGLSQQTISYVESGKNDFSMGTLKKILGVLGLELRIVDDNSQHQIKTSYTISG